MERLLPACRERARRRELEVLAASLLNRPVEGFRAVLLNGFRVEPKGRKSSGAEFGGACIDVNADGATLRVLQAQSGAGSRAAVSRLRGQLRRLGWLEGSQVVATEGGAEAAVTLRLRVRR